MLAFELPYFACLSILTSPSAHTFGSVEVGEDGEDEEGATSKSRTTLKSSASKDEA